MKWSSLETYFILFEKVYECMIYNYGNKIIKSRLAMPEKVNGSFQEKIMFRKVTRSKQVISDEECIYILKAELRGVLSVLGDDDYPYGLPINHYYNEEDGKIYFHSGKLGHKVDAIKRHPKASFCVYNSGDRLEDHWYLTFKSVIVFGKIEIIGDREKIFDIARKLSRKFTDDTDYIEHEVESSGPGTLMFALVPEHMTGKQVNER